MADTTASLPTRERGLKDSLAVAVRVHPIVAPYTGAWIERTHSVLSTFSLIVAPYTGAWIERYCL